MERVKSVTPDEAESIERFLGNAVDAGWTQAMAQASKTRVRDVLKYAHLNEHWDAVSELLDAALESSKLASTETASRVADVRRAARWAAKALIIRHLRDELEYGALDHAVLTLPWAVSVGSVHPDDMAENAWLEFSEPQVGSRLHEFSPTNDSEKNGPTGPTKVDSTPGFCHVRYWVDPHGMPIASGNEEAWLAARRTGVTATDARKLVKANGMPSAQRSGLLHRKLNDESDYQFASFENGVEREPIIAAWVTENFGITHNTHLCMGENHRHLATPDGIGDGVICEIKTSIDPLQKAVRTYRDQLQWQLHVTGSDRVLLVVENRYSREREHRWVERDEERIAVLVAHADDFLLELDAGFRDRREVEMGVKVPLVAPNRTVRFVESPESREPIPRASPPNREGRASAREEWRPGESRDVVLAYARGENIAAIARTHDTDASDIVRELSRWLLVVEGEMVDESAGRFGFTWEQRERESLARDYFPGVPVVLLAEAMHRDQLGIAFQLFGARLPVVSEALILMLDSRAQ